MENSIKVIITQPALFQMLTLCQKWPNLEWSGFCLHTKSDDLFQETIIVHAVYLMNVGTATATDFYGNPDMAELLVDNPDLSELVFNNGYRFIQCKVHSHNNMQSYFSQGSGVSDQQDLEDNSKGQDMYVSIVVNNKMEFFARACRWVKTEEIEKTVQVLHNGSNSCSNTILSIIFSFPFESSRIR